jgi:hypothetical protein
MCNLFIKQLKLLKIFFKYHLNNNILLNKYQQNYLLFIFPLIIFKLKLLNPVTVLINAKNLYNFTKYVKNKIILMLYLVKKEFLDFY